MTLLGLDHAAFRFVNLRLANPAFDRVMPWVTALGSEAGVALLFAVALFVYLFRDRREALRLALTVAAALLAAGGVNRIVKVEVNRPRPQMVIPGTHKVDQDLTQYSFPSGHTASAFAGATVLAGAIPGAAPYAFAFAALVGFSRVYVGAHFPSDVLGGAPIGILFGLLSVRWIWRRGRRPRRATPEGSSPGPPGG